ncbi:hypothetical protein LTS15_000042 [Exophiala xenobiotica]|nr:hypothetical protein LTS15_000042 [Exophiala xenobiotica]
MYSPASTLFAYPLIDSQVTTNTPGVAGVRNRTDNVFGARSRGLFVPRPDLPNLHTIKLDFVDETRSLRASHASVEDSSDDGEHGQLRPVDSAISTLPSQSQLRWIPKIPQPVDSLSESSSQTPRQYDFPLITREAAELTRYFVDYCACFFDFSDFHRHFAYDVPLRARRNATLANAMLALAARHRSRTQEYDPYVSDRYYHECLQTLIPRLGDPAAIKDDELLAAVIILRLLEEMDVSIMGSDPQGHLLGTQAIITVSQTQSPSPVTSLRKACYWGAFRQEIFTSLTFQRPLKLQLPEKSSSKVSADDWEWSLNAIYLCGKVQGFVFGNDVANTAEYGRLLEEVGAWKRNRPRGFDPLFQSANGQSEFLPDIRLHMDCHVMGWQYISMSYLLLIVHQPFPRVGPSRKQALLSMEQAAAQEIVADIRTANRMESVGLYFGRIILGYGVGACAAGVPLYVNEIAPAELRGRIIGIEQMILCLGELIAFWLDYGFAYLQTPDWWRIPLAIQDIPAAVLAIGCWVWVPPSPRWLVQQDRHECAREVLARFHGDEAAELEMQEIAENVAFEQTVVAMTTWTDLFRWQVLRVTLLGAGVQFFQQITGTNFILYCSPSLFERGGIEDAHTRNLATGGIGIVLFVFAWIPIFVFDRLGRKTWLQIGVVGMMCAMIGITGEPTNWVCNWLGLYIIYAGICVLAFTFVQYAMVETRGRTLEEMSRLFGIEEKLAVRSGINPASALQARNKEVVQERVEEVDR